jgi:hypothetical protein
MGNEVERTGENWTQGRGRKGKEAEGNRKATRAGRPVEEPVSDRGKKWRESGREAENAKRGVTPLEKRMRRGENWRGLDRTGRKEGEGKKAKGEEATRRRSPSGSGDVYPGDPGP